MTEFKIRPTSCQWDITPACNLKCIHCRASHMDRRKPPIDTKAGYKLIDQIVALCKKDPWIVLAGGEPTTRPDLKKLLEYIGTKDFHYKSILTNGTLISEEMAKWLAELTTRIQVSLEGSTPETNDVIRGRGSFVKAVHGIKNLIKAGADISIRMTYSVQPKDEVVKMMKLTHDLGVKEFDFRRITPVIGTDGFALKDTLKDSSNVYKELCELVWKLKDKYDLNVEMGDPFTRLLIDPERRKYAEDNDELMNGTMIGGCSVGTDSIYIDPWGRVLLCPYLPIYCGDTAKKTLSEIWFNSETFHLFRGIRYNLKGKCGKCKFKYACGGCRAAAYGMKDDICEEDPRCWYEP